MRFAIPKDIIANVCLKDKNHKALTFLTINIVFIFSFLILCGWWHADKYINDDADYISHAFTIALSHNLDYSKELSGSVPLGPIGPGLIAAPFVYIFSLIDKYIHAPIIMDHRAIKGSWSLFGFAFASSFCFLHGVYLYFLSSREIGKFSKLFIFLTSAGTGILYYTTNRFSMAHSFEFWSLSLSLYAAIKLVFEKRNLYINIMCFLAVTGATLSWLCRTYSISSFLLPFFVLFSVTFYYKKNFKESLFYKKIRLLLLWQTIVAIPTILLQFRLYDNIMYFKYFNASTDWIVSNQEQLSFPALFIGYLLLAAHRFAVNLPIVLFGDNFGLMYTSAIIPYGIMLYFMFVYSTQYARKLKIFAILLYLMCISIPFIMVTIGAHGTGAYGYRYLYCVLPFSYLGIMLWRKFCFSYKPMTKIILTSLLLFSIFGTINMMVFSTAPRDIDVMSKVDQFGIVRPMWSRNNITFSLYWLARKKGYEVIYDCSSLKLLPLIFKGKPMTTFSTWLYDNMSIHIVIMYLLWNAFAIYYVFFTKDQDEIETVPSPLLPR